MDIKKVIDHLQIIHTWAAVGKDPIYNGIESKCCEDIEKWTEDTIALLKEQEETIDKLLYQIGKQAGILTIKYDK